MIEARGNVDTRIARLAEGRFDAIVLARAGLARLARLEEVSEVLPTSLILPAIGQGALAIDARGDDRATLDRSSRRWTTALRTARPRRSEACSPRSKRGARLPSPVSPGSAMDLSRSRRGVFSPDGSRALREESRGPASEAVSIGRDVGRNSSTGGRRR